MTATTSDVLKPQPRVNELTRPYWDGANNGKLMIQRCADCGRGVFYPRVCCPFCKGSQLDWIEASGRGRVITHTTVRRTHHDGFNSDAPYVFAAVALAEGPCMYAQLPDAPLEGSLVGREVAVEFAEHGPGRRMPIFRLTAA
jgi:uncharacterized OB-fold protein